MRAQEVRALADSLGVSEILDETKLDYLEEVLQDLRENAEILAGPSRVPGEIATILERLALDSEGEATERRHLFKDAYLARRGSGYRETDLGRLLHYVRLAADGILGDRQAEVSLLLREKSSELAFGDEQHQWPEVLLLHISLCFILLCRKSRGWDDVREATDGIAALRELQLHAEQVYVTAVDEASRLEAVGELIVEYNLAKIVDIVARYTITGTPNDALVQVDRHSANVRQVFESYHNASLSHYSDLLSEASKALIRGSIWFGTRSFGENTHKFLQNLVSDTQERPVFDLWPSQRTALTSGLLDAGRRAIVVEMPTSAGKTLIAEFSIIQALTLNPKSKIAYVVPTRALVNQIIYPLEARFFATRLLRGSSSPRF